MTQRRQQKQLVSAEEILEVQINQSLIRIFPFVREHRFCLLRNWRFDFAWLKEKYAVEIHGGIWRRNGGAHTGVGHLRDLEKGNEAVLLDWRVFCFTTDQVKKGEAIAFLERRLFKVRQ